MLLRLRHFNDIIMNDDVDAKIMRIDATSACVTLLCAAAHTRTHTQAKAIDAGQRIFSLRAWSLFVVLNCLP